MSHTTHVHLPRLIGSVAISTVIGAAVLTAPEVGAATLQPGGVPPPVLRSDRPASTAPLASAALSSTGTAAKQKQKDKKLKARFAKHSEAIVSIRSVRIARFVYSGGQRTIDRAVVAHYNGWRDTYTRPGRPGVYWLAAHNYGSHGPFHRLLRIKQGARIVVTTRSGAKYVYRVDRRRVVDSYVPRTVVWGRWGPTAGPPRAVLQTCVGNKRLLVYATLLR